VRFVEQTQPVPGRASVAAEIVARLARRASPVTATVLGALVLAELIATLVLEGLDHQLTWSLAVIEPPGLLIFAGVGVVVARRQPRNPVGWILIVFSLLIVLAVAAGLYAVLCYRLGHGGLPLAAAAVVLAPAAAWPAFALVPLAIFLFPDGQLSRPWRWVLRAFAALYVYEWVVSVAPAVAAVAGNDVHLDSSGHITDTSHLTGWLVHQPGWLTAVVISAVGVIWLSFVGHQVASWRHAAGERRQQLKWLAFGAAIALGVGVVGSQLASGLASGILAAGLAALPVSIGVGILKYRLYDIDRIISRTLAYALLTGLLVGVYAGLVLLATQVLAIKSPVAVAAATLAAAALFTPLRHRVQRLVDRRFNRARYDADTTVAAFAARLKDAVDLDSVRDDLASAVQRALEPTHVSVWTRTQVSSLQPAPPLPSGPVGTASPIQPSSPRREPS
jgi:hypothetical protein